MCTRFYVEPDKEEIREIIAEVQRSQLSGKYIKAGNAILTSGEIRPTNVVPVIAPNRNGHRAAFPMKWRFSNSGQIADCQRQNGNGSRKANLQRSLGKASLHHTCVMVF